MTGRPAGAKRVVLLSDGTGNSSAKLARTNVWRMYDALDVTVGDQVAMYDNGVGTSAVRPLALLGGAFGWGLKRNVLSLYEFACRNYSAGTGNEAADAIYAFGFSRGAFTIRVLIGMIESEGLVTGVKGRELTRQATWAYRAYRAKYNPTGGLVAPLRRIRDWILKAWERKPAYDHTRNVRPRVSFVGLWDTVDAYGLPIDELTRGWDRWVWPFSLRNNICPPIVEKACHAISLDDERQTFHPVLFDESAEPPRHSISDERITQVWFAGVHSNVGGGYPDDSLAHVTLRWMAEQASEPTRYLPLRLHPHVTNAWEARADANGPIYDSRRGLGTSYRYSPRSIQRLTCDPYADVLVPLPKIHESVFRRIASGPDDYAPIVLPERYAVVTSHGNILADLLNPFEHSTQAAARSVAQEHVWNDVWKRRIAYFTTVILTFLMIVPPFLLGANGGGLLNFKSRALGGVIDLLGGIAPAWVRPWVAYYRDFPVQLLLGVILLGVLLWYCNRLQHSIRDRMRASWDVVVQRPARETLPAPLPSNWIFRFRTHPLYRKCMEIATQQVAPFIFGFGALLALAWVATGTANRALFAGFSAAGKICRDTTVASWDGTPRRLSLPSSAICLRTGLHLRQGETYRVEIKSKSSDWADASIAVQTAAGFSSGKKPLVFVSALPFRRIVTAQWFVPMVRIGAYSAEYHPLDKEFAEFTPRHSGQLFLFVNDAIVVWPWFGKLYENNHGAAEIEVSLVRRTTRTSPTR